MLSPSLPLRMNSAKHLAAECTGLIVARGQTLRFAQGDGPKYGVEYCDRTVSISEVARRAVEKLQESCTPLQAKGVA